VRLGVKKAVAFVGERASDCVEEKREDSGERGKARFTSRNQTQLCCLTPPFTWLPKEFVCFGSVGSIGSVCSVVGLLQCHQQLSAMKGTADAHVHPIPQVNFDY
jgi:hypothetical protein